MTDAGLPQFEHPPVVEAVIGIEFSPLEVRTLDLLRYADSWAEHYPTITEVPSLEPTQPPGQPVPQLTLQLTGPLPPIRLWMTSPDEQFLVQLQRDRLLMNWRKTVQDAEYPGYAELRRRFDAQLASFVERILGSDPTGMIVLGVEFTYFNRVIHNQTPDQLFRHFSEPVKDLPGTPVAMRFQEIRNISDDRARTHGQLTLSSEPQPTEAGTIEQFNITTRWFPEGITPGDTLQTLIDKGHETSRAAFVALTTHEKQTEWGIS